MLKVQHGDMDTKVRTPIKSNGKIINSRDFHFTPPRVPWALSTLPSARYQRQTGAACDRAARSGSPGSGSQPEGKWSGGERFVGMLQGCDGAVKHLLSAADHAVQN